MNGRRCEKNESFLLTIAVINYNGERYLERCLESIEKNTLVQYILIDGGSSDCSLKIINKYKDKFDVIVSEKDKGQSDALNKSLGYSKGIYYTWINSDDLMCSENLVKIVERLSLEKADWLIAGTRFIDQNDSYLREYIQPKIAKIFNHWGFVSVGGPSSLIKTQLIKQSGGFDETLNYCMDVDMWIRLWNKGIRYQNINAIFYIFRIHAQSKTSHAYNKKPVKQFEEERNFVLKKNRRKEGPILIILRKCSGLLSVQAYKNNIGKLKKIL